ncbi:hypothetical protein GCM10020295_02400 [Streptomyces cinereospinus]
MNFDHAFVCGHPALDFAATLRARRSTRFEMFVTPERLNAWYLESGLVDTITPGDEDDVREAIRVREALYRLITDRRLGEEFDREALAVLNGAARAVPVTPQLTVRGGTPRRRPSRPWPPSPGRPSSCSAARTSPC